MMGLKPRTMQRRLDMHGPIHIIKEFLELENKTWAVSPVSYTHLTLPTNREV